MQRKYKSNTKAPSGMMCTILTSFWHAFSRQLLEPPKPLNCNEHRMATRSSSLRAFQFGINMASTNLSEIYAFPRITPGRYFFHFHIDLYSNFTIWGPIWKLMESEMGQANCPTGGKTTKKDITTRSKNARVLPQTPPEARKASFSLMTERATRRKDGQRTTTTATATTGRIRRDGRRRRDGQTYIYIYIYIAIDIDV